MILPVDLFFWWFCFCFCFCCCFFNFLLKSTFSVPHGVISLAEANAIFILDKSKTVYGCKTHWRCHRARHLQEKPLKTESEVHAAVAGPGPTAQHALIFWGLTSWVTALGHDCGWRRLASSFPVASRNCSLIIPMKNTYFNVYLCDFWRQRKLATKRILAGGLKLSYMGDNPSHWLSYVSTWLLHHQPVTSRFCRRVSFHYRSAPGCRSCAKRLWNIAKRQQAILFCLMMGMDQNMWKLKTFVFTKKIVRIELTRNPT